MSKHEVACSNLRVGDTVRVERKDTERKTNGYHNTWTNDMDLEIGQSFVIDEIGERNGVRFSSGSRCRYPAHVLKVVKAAATRDAVKVRVGGKYLARNGDVVEFVRHDPNDDTYQNTKSWWYKPDGQYLGAPENDPNTLVRELANELVAPEALGGKITVGNWYVTKSGKLAKANGGGFSDSTIVYCSPFGYFRIENGAYNGHNGHDYDLVRLALPWEYEGRVSGDKPNAPTKLQLEAGKWYVTNGGQLALMGASSYNSHTLWANKLGNYDVNGGIYTGFPADYPQSIKREATEAEYAGRKSGDMLNKPVAAPAVDKLQEDLREGMWYMTRDGKRAKACLRSERDLSDVYPYIAKLPDGTNLRTLTKRGAVYDGQTNPGDLVRLADEQDPVTCDAAPAPAPGVEVVAGKWYMTRGGKRVKVQKRNSSSFPFEYNEGGNYSINVHGFYYWPGDESRNDLVRLADEQDAPLAMPTETAKKLMLLAGSWYITRSSKIVQVERRSGANTDQYPFHWRYHDQDFLTSDRNACTAEGRYYWGGREHKDDLVRQATVAEIMVAIGQDQPRIFRAATGAPVTGVVMTHVVHDEFFTVTLVDQQGGDSTQPTSSTTLEEDDTMSSIIKIEKLTLVNGENIAHMSDSSIISAIERAEADIKRLEALGTKPAFVVKQIEDLKAGISELAKVADERTAKKA